MLVKNTWVMAGCKAVFLVLTVLNPLHIQTHTHMHTLVVDKYIKM